MMRSTSAKFAVRIFAVSACAALLCLFSQTARRAWRNKSATFDEPTGLVAAWLATHDGDCRCFPEDPPLFNYYVAAGTRADDLKIDRQSSRWDRMLREHSAAWDYCIDVLYHTPGNDPDLLIRRARDRMIVLGILLGMLIAWWAWRLAGPMAAVVALGAYCLDPNFLAHAPLIKNDVPLALALTALMAAVWLLGERATWPRCLAVVLLAAIIPAIKYSGFLGIAILGAALLCRAVMGHDWRILSWTARTRRQRLFAAAVLFAAVIPTSYLIIWAGYRFTFGPTGDPARLFDPRQFELICAQGETIRAHGDPLDVSPAQLRDWVSQWQPGVLVRATRWADAHHFLPQGWLMGWLTLYGASITRRSFLCGQLSMAGWWYYFPLAMLFKTPLATLIGLSPAVVLCLRWRQILRRGAAWPLCAAAAAPVIYLAAAMASPLDLGLRHVLPVYPYLFILLGVMAAMAARRFPRATAAIVCLVGLGLATETYCAYPDFIPFFNIAAGGARGGLELLSDSNLDWGQDLPALAAWQRQHSDRQLYLSYFGTADPRYYGIYYVEIPGTLPAHPDQTTPQNLPKAYAISATTLQGTYLDLSQSDQLKWYRSHQPTAVLGGSIYVYSEIAGDP
jgi:hypothetical protein